MPSRGQSATMMAELQAEHAIETTNETNAVILQDENEATKSRANKQTNTITNAIAYQAMPATTDTESDRTLRKQVALDRAATDELIVVTVRVPAVLNRYMDDYVARIYRGDSRRKYRKQDAVAAAFAAFYADYPMPPAPCDANLL